MPKISAKCTDAVDKLLKIAKLNKFSLNLSTKKFCLFLSCWSAVFNVWHRRWIVDTWHTVWLKCFLLAAMGQMFWRNTSNKHMLSTYCCSLTTLHTNNICDWIYVVASRSRGGSIIEWIDNGVTMHRQIYIMFWQIALDQHWAVCYKSSLRYLNVGGTLNAHVVRPAYYSKED